MTPIPRQHYTREDDGGTVGRVSLFYGNRPVNAKAKLAEKAYASSPERKCPSPKSPLGGHWFIQTDQEGNQQIYTCKNCPAMTKRPLAWSGTTAAQFLIGG